MKAREITPIHPGEILLHDFMLVRKHNASVSTRSPEQNW
jgi:hypothetical protein